MTGESKAQWWFNTVTKSVEQGPQSLAVYRIGPFETEAEAVHAEAIVAEKARKIREEDEAEDFS